jgi:hypothetical protein
LVRAKYIEPLTPAEQASSQADYDAEFPPGSAMTQPNTPPSERRSHVVPVDDEPRAPLTPPQPTPVTPAVESPNPAAPPPPPDDQRPAMPDRSKETGPPPDQRPARTDISTEPGPPKGQEPARTPQAANDATISRDDAEELKRNGGRQPVAPQTNNPPVLDPDRSRVQNKIGKDTPDGFVETTEPGDVNRKYTPRRRLPE